MVDEHPRYKNVINIFRDTLRNYIEGTMSSISDIVSYKKMKAQGLINPNIVFKVIKSRNARSKSNIGKRYFDYEFSKLFEKHPIFEINYFMKKFSHDVLIMIELNNMKEFIDNELEYYSSYEYLRLLMIERGLLNNRF